MLDAADMETALAERESGALNVKTFSLALKVDQSAGESRPRTLELAVGMQKVCVEPAEVMVKSTQPEDAVENVWVSAVREFREVIPPPVPPPPPATTLTLRALFAESKTRLIIWR